MPEGYPFQPLQMRFISKVRQGDLELTQVYHPNVSSQSGAICLDILKGTCSKLTIRPVDAHLYAQVDVDVAALAAVLA